MADIVVRRNGGQIQPATPFREWEPLRMFRELMNWDPFQEMAPLLRRELRAPTFLPDFDVKETKDSYLFRADLPGVKEQDIDVSITGSRITVSGKREEESEEKTDTYYACERSYGSFTRSFTLPEGADTEHVQAELKSGVLSLVIPKRPEVQPKKIAVKSGEKSAKA